MTIYCSYGCVWFGSNWSLENVLHHRWCLASQEITVKLKIHSVDYKIPPLKCKMFYTLELPSKHFHSSQNSSPHSHSHHSRHAQAKGGREAPSVKPRTSHQPTAPPLCLQAPPLMKVVWALLSSSPDPSLFLP